jgi:hypothetical protein
MFLFYVFWEVMLLPMYFLIGIWGGPRREYAAIKFFLYTLAGSVLLLLVMIGLYFSTIDPQTGAHTFNMIAMMDPANVTKGIFATIGSSARMLAFVGLFIGFAIKVPIFPFHTWLPDAHVEAPTAISVILAGVLLKMGTYGLLRISFPIFPEMAHVFPDSDDDSRFRQHRLRRALRHGADGLQEADRIFLGFAHGVRAARHGGAERAGYDRRGVPDVQSRHDHRDALPIGGRAL